MQLPLPWDDQRDPATLWAHSGAMWLTGHPDASPRPCPAPLAACAQGAWLALCALREGVLDTGFDAHRLLGERAAIAGHSRRGQVSPGGACHLLETADSALALNLARESDRELLPAWLERPVSDDEDIAALLRQRSTGDMVERARLLGLAAAPLTRPVEQSFWFRSTRHTAPRPPRPTAPLVIDLSALWAGPLCGQLLSQCGARVIKVESAQRPDGARNGPPAFYHLMNTGKESVALDLGSQEGRRQLRRLIAHADIIIESTRPRALEQMGIAAADCIHQRPGQVWLGISGYGRREPERNWIAYGDDAGVAAGLSWLVGGEGADPVFCGDAIADPLTGLHGALLAWVAWQQGGGVLLDLALRDMVSWVISAGTVSDSDEPAVPPVARPVKAEAASLGADTERVLREFT